MKKLIDKIKKTIKISIDKTKEFCGNIIKTIDNHTNPKLGFFAYKFFKILTLTMFLIIVPLTPIIICSFDAFDVVSQGVDPKDVAIFNPGDWAMLFGVLVLVITICTSMLWFWFSKFSNKK